MLRRSAFAATYNMALQFFLKIISFTLNMVIIRHLSKDMLGVINIRLFLLNTTVLFLSTEAIDNACLSKFEDRNWTHIINLSWLTVPLACLFGAIFSYIWLYVLDVPDPEVIPHYHLGVIAYAFAPAICNMARPHFIIAMSYFFVGLRVGTVAFSESFKVLVSVALIIWMPELGIVAFGFGQIMGECAYVFLYYSFFALYLDDTLDPSFPFQYPRDFLPKRIKPLVDKRQSELTKSFFKQCFLKIFLTEGEKYVMTIFRVLSLAEQGIYGTVSNLGAMVPRFVFAPIEESGRLFFSQLLHRGEKHIDQSKEEAQLAYQVLKHLLRGMFLIGSIMLVFGNSYSYLLLNFYGGRVLSECSGPYILKWFFVYVLVLAVNGIMECFHFALMDTEETDSYNHKMLLFSVLSLIGSLILPKYFGGAGFILANCAVMLARIYFSLLFINEYYSGTALSPLRSLIPSIPLTAAFIISFVIMKISEHTFCCSFGFVYRLVHVGVGIVCLAGVLLVIFLTEKDLQNFVLKHYRKQPPKKE